MNKSIYCTCSAVKVIGVSYPENGSHILYKTKGLAPS